MRYRELIASVNELDFIPDKQTAASAVKAVLGTLASRMEEAEAKKLIEHLPEPLNFETLRGHQVRPTVISVEQYYEGICEDFDLDRRQAQILVTTVLHQVKESFEREDFEEIETALPSDWSDMIERV